jgi:hypothetical protein
MAEFHIHVDAATVSPEFEAMVLQHLASRGTTSAQGLVLAL